MSAVAARARGLVTTVLPREALAELDAARDARELAAVLAHTGLGALHSADDLDRLARDRVASDLAILARWTDALAAIELDEDRRSLRGIVRGLAAADVPAERRLAGAVPTRRLPAELLDQLARAASPAELAALLADHPYATVLASAGTPINLLAVELELARCFATLARTRDRALRTYIAQLVDAENAAAALLLAERGADVPHQHLPHGRLVDRATFEKAAAGRPDAARVLLARALAGTPLTRALHGSRAMPFEEATLAWQLATQARLRRTDPLGLAPALYTLLRRREEARCLRRVAWRLALRGGT